MLTHLHANPHCNRNFRTGFLGHQLRLFPTIVSHSRALLLMAPLPNHHEREGQGTSRLQHRDTSPSPLSREFLKNGLEQQREQGEDALRMVRVNPDLRHGCDMVQTPNLREIHRCYPGELWTDYVIDSLQGNHQLGDKGGSGFI